MAPLFCNSHKVRIRKGRFYTQVEMVVSVVVKSHGPVVHATGESVYHQLAEVGSSLCTICLDYRDLGDSA